MRVTLKMIAERAGVHISTVDKVIHNRGGVSKEVEAISAPLLKNLDIKQTLPDGPCSEAERGTELRFFYWMLMHSPI